MLFAVVVVILRLCTVLNRICCNSRSMTTTTKVKTKRAFFLEYLVICGVKFNVSKQETHKKRKRTK